MLDIEIVFWITFKASDVISQFSPKYKLKHSHLGLLFTSLHFPWLEHVSFWQMFFFCLAYITFVILTTLTIRCWTRKISYILNTCTIIHTWTAGTWPRASGTIWTRIIQIAYAYKFKPNIRILAKTIICTIRNAIA